MTPPLLPPLPDRIALLRKRTGAHELDLAETGPVDRWHLALADAFERIPKPHVWCCHLRTAPILQGLIRADRDLFGLRSFVRPPCVVHPTAGPDDVRLPGARRASLEALTARNPCLAATRQRRVTGPEQAGACCRDVWAGVPEYAGLEAQPENPPISVVQVSATTSIAD